MMQTNTTNANKAEGKNPIASWTIWGGVVLSALNIADILTGDPWSLNGAVKWAGLVLGAVLVFAGRSRAERRLRWAKLFSWFYNSSQRDEQA